MTKLDFDELHTLVEAAVKIETEDELINEIRGLLKSAYERAVLDMEEEFDFLFFNYPDALDNALRMPTEGLTWEQRIRSWYKGENPNTSDIGLISDGDSIHNKTSMTASEGGTPPSPDVEAIKRVVDTEYHRMANAGAYDTAVAINKTGKTIYKRWDTMLDEKVRSTHLYLEGDRVPLDRAFFTFDGDSAMYPGGFTLASNNVNCRCGLSYEEGTSEKTQSARERTPNNTEKEIINES